jgi:hypothetical protein
LSDAHFYEELPVFDDFARITEPGHYQALPEEWHVVIADVEGSTAAIAAGRYKEVNVVGAASIVAVLNAHPHPPSVGTRPLRVPFVFGGDGASLCVPDSVVGPVREALLATKRMAREEFNLALRVGIVPVREIHAAGHRVLVARYRVSEHYTQAVFTGGGLAFAEACLKDPERGRRYRLESGDGDPAGRFAGLECRWDDIPSPHGETVALVAMAVAPEPERRAAVYRQVLDRIRAIYGEDDLCRPVRRDKLRLARSDRKLAVEAHVQSAGRGRLFRAGYWVWLKLQMAVGYVVFPRDLTFAGVDWGEYQREVVANSDCRKFDDLLREVLAGTPQQREELTRALEELHRQGELVYGLHAAPSALMTCVIFNRHGEHVHFVDSAQGGYAMAAAQMKQQRICAESPTASPGP